MNEYVTEAIVLNHSPRREQDSSIVLFTRRFGKLRVRAKSARKITSKLAGHLQPGNWSVVRLVDAKGLQVVDALKRGHVAIPPPHLYLLDQLLPEAEADSALWNLLREGEFSWSAALALLGWDSAYALCRECGGRAPDSFHIRTQDFVCAKDASKIKAHELISLHTA